MTNDAIPAETLAVIKAHNLRPQQDVKFWYLNRAGERVQVKGRVVKLINGKAGLIVRLVLMEYEPGTLDLREVNYLIANIEMPTTEEVQRRHQQGTSCANGCEKRGVVHRCDSSGISGMVCRSCNRLPQYLLSYS